LPVLADWLTQPHVSKWWGEPNRELELIRTGRSSGEADGYVVYLAGQPMGYVQSWVPANFDEEEWMQQQPEGTIGVDIFVGEPAVTGKGLGPAIIRQFCAKLIDDGAKRIIIDPDPANERAVSAYRKAGFRPLAEYPSPSGATLLMEFNREVCRGQA
jgi:aminoglycoside 6'-N-acetyltransferase